MTTQAQINKRVRECVQLAKQKYGFNIPYEQIVITYKSKGQAAASAWARRMGIGGKAHQFGLKFSIESANLSADEMLNDTIPHEVAHLVCFFDPSLGKNHDLGWKRVCRGLGGSGDRTHSQVLTKARYKSQYLYKLTDTKTTTVGPKVHKNIQRGATYTNRNTGISYGKSEFIRHITPEEHKREHLKEVNAYREAAATTAAPAKEAPASHKRPVASKRPAASQVRPTSKKVRAQTMYDANKPTDRATMIKLFIDNLGMTKAGASTYWSNLVK